MKLLDTTPRETWHNLKMCWPPYQAKVKQNIADGWDTFLTNQRLDDEDLKYRQPSYQKPKGQSWDEYRWLPF